MPYYRRRPYYGRRRRQYGSRKALLNVTSRKKQDTMLPYTNTTASAPSGGTTFTNAAATLIGGNTYFFPWVVTARDNTIGANPATIFATATRTATTCYMRGLKERIQVQTSSGMPWQWRRICFTLKGDAIYKFNETAYKVWADTSSGIGRVVSNTGVTSNLAVAIFDLVFKGTANNDWTAVFNAKCDNTRITLKYDKTCYIRSGNASGVMRDYHRWHPMNENLVYDDDENGDSMLPNYFSTDGRAGMGDYYVLDIIAAGTGSTSSDILTFNPQSTLYWHER